MPDFDDYSPARLGDQIRSALLADGDLSRIESGWFDYIFTVDCGGLVPFTNEHLTEAADFYHWFLTGCGLDGTEIDRVLAWYDGQPKQSDEPRQS